MERAVEQVVEVFQDPVPDGKSRPTRRRYSRNDPAAWALLGLWRGNPVTNITIDQRHGPEPSYRVEATYRSFAGEEFWSEGSGETFALAVCRMFLQAQCDDDCETPDTGEYLVPPEIQASLLVNSSQRLHTSGFIGLMPGAVETGYGQPGYMSVRTYPTPESVTEAARQVLELLARDAD